MRVFCKRRARRLHERLPTTLAHPSHAADCPQGRWPLCVRHSASFSRPHGGRNVSSRMRRGSIVSGQVRHSMGNVFVSRPRASNNQSAPHWVVGPTSRRRRGSGSDLRLVGRCHHLSAHSNRGRRKLLVSSQVMGRTCEIISSRCLYTSELGTVWLCLAVFLAIGRCDGGIVDCLRTLTEPKADVANRIASRVCSD